MPDNDVPYKFYDYHRPPLVKGDYDLTLTVTQTVTVPGKSVTASYSPASKITFTVGAEKYSLKPDDIHSVFPPEGSLGAYENSLPHIVLTRSTLPWEYSALSSQDSEREKVPWLALLLFHEDEVIEIKDPSILPKANELTLLCHVRAPSQSSNPQEYVAVVLGKRKPKPGRNTVHLISLEGRFPNSSFDNKATFTTLKSWDFYCDKALSEQHESLDRLFEKIQPVLLRYPDPENTSSDLKKFLSQGMVALPHHLRTGETTVSWYRGPLIPGKPSTTAQAKITNTADALLQYHPDLAMLDVGYAAAWELGRLLTLQNKAIATTLQRWRFQEECLAYCQVMAHKDSDCCHLPAVQRRAQAADKIQVPPALTQWFNDLRQLKGIPFRYLVPDDRILPTETIAFFYVDPCWIDHLLSGVFSLIDQPTNYTEQCQQAILELLGNSPRQDLITGFLMRSAAVAGWSGLIVQGFAKEDDQSGLSATSDRLEPYAHAQLSPNVLMHLFKGEVRRVTLEQKPETLHSEVPQTTLDLSNVTSGADLAQKLSHQIQSLTLKIQLS